MYQTDFSDVTTWVFDLDHTLYPPDMALFDQINLKMTDFVMKALKVTRDEADHMRNSYWREHGTTLAGLMDNHGMEPEQFLQEVHEIDFTVLEPDPELAKNIQALPGRRIIYTNGTADYAENVLEHRGLSGLFDAIYGVEHAQFRPKPERIAFDRVFAKDGLDPSRAAMFEDDIRNLLEPHAMGMRTVHVAPKADPHPHIHHHTDNLSAFLAGLV